MNDDQKAYPNPIPYITEATQTGKVTILFTEALQEIFAKLDLRTEKYKLDLRTEKYEAEPDVWKQALSVEIEPSVSQDPERVAFDWAVLSQSTNKIEIQLSFEEPLQISSYKEPDVLVIKFVDE